MNISLYTLCAVFLLIAVQQVGGMKLQIWQIMLGGAVLVLSTGDITPNDALKSIDVDVMIFLFGMFVVGHALEESGYLAHISYKYFKRAGTLNGLVLRVLFGAGLLSALLMNDTLAIIGTPVMLLLARKHAMSSKPLLLALAFGITIGSVISPIGNPQNLLIAIHGNLANPFVLFLRWLFIPTVLNLFVAFALLKLMFRDDFHKNELRHSQEPIRNHELALLSRISLGITIILVSIKIVTASFGFTETLTLPHIAVAASLPILIGSKQRLHILRKIDWHTLIFFAALFILMESVWNTGFFQNTIKNLKMDMRAPGIVILVSVIVSQFISNVPLVALLLPAIMSHGGSTAELMALAAGSTIAGNLTILGAASNVIIIHNAERRSKETLSFLEFARIGIPLTIVNASIYWLCLRWL